VSSFFLSFVLDFVLTFVSDLDDMGFGVISPLYMKKGGKNPPPFELIFHQAHLGL
jgi:hypothetical protein